MLHEGPAGGHHDQPGSAVIGAALRTRTPALTVCGHVHWADPVARNGHVLNVDGRAVLLTP